MKYRYIVGKGQLISKCLFGIFNSPKNEWKRSTLLSTMVPQVELFSFVFWENWRHQKVISKLTDLYLPFFEILGRKVWKCGCAVKHVLNKMSLLTNSLHVFTHLFSRIFQPTFFWRSFSWILFYEFFSLLAVFWLFQSSFFFSVCHLKKK